MIIRFTSTSTGVPMAARLVCRGDTYGLGNCLTHDEAEEPMVEFYDLRFAHVYVDPIEKRDTGQFITRYYLLALVERSAGPDAGLDLNMGVKAWKVGPEVNRVVNSLYIAFLATPGINDVNSDRPKHWPSTELARKKANALPVPTALDCDEAKWWFHDLSPEVKGIVWKKLVDVFGPHWGILEMTRYYTMLVKLGCLP